MIWHSPAAIVDTSSLTVLTSADPDGMAVRSFTSSEHEPAKEHQKNGNTGYADE
jgi:hypothetical protein